MKKLSKINFQNNNGVGDNETLNKLQYQFEIHLTCLYLAELNRFGRID